MKLQTNRLELCLQTPQEVLNWVETLPPEVRREISEDWLSRLRQATAPDPWSCMFAIIDRDTGNSVGSCGFKAPPDSNGTVELAYEIEEQYRGSGYATESVGALVEFASNEADVNIVIAQTKPDNRASTQVLRKLEFVFVGEVDDPEDGLVHRWQREVSTSALAQMAMPRADAKDNWPDLFR